VLNNITDMMKSQKIPPMINLSLRAPKISLISSWVAFSVVRFFLNPNCSLTNMLLEFKSSSSLSYSL
jgi:hypothetical protein